MPDVTLPGPRPAPRARRRGRILALWLLGLLVVVLLAVWLLSPWWTLARMKQALDARDAQAFSAYVDYPAVRESLKPAIAAHVKNELLQQMNRYGGAAAGLGLNGLVEQVTGAATAAAVDAAVTPAGLMALLLGMQARDAVGGLPSVSPSVGAVTEPAPVPPATRSGARPPLRFDGGYESPNRFAVVLLPPNGGEVRFVMQRQGFANWRLVEIVLPT